MPDKTAACRVVKAMFEDMVACAAVWNVSITASYRQKCVTVDRVFKNVAS